MNFLAHLYLSHNHPKVMLGNFIGDFVKGRNVAERYEPGIATGIELHRAIDEYTDSHEVVKESKNRLRPKYRHYSGVIVDVFYDHFLAANWSDYHEQPLREYAAHAYYLVQSNLISLPDQVGSMLPYMIQTNWLVSYSEIEGVNRALTGMSRRTPFESKMNEASADLREHYNDFQKEFKAFFPDAITFSKEFLSKHRFDS